MDRNLNSLLKWSIENTDSAKAPDTNGDAPKTDRAAEAPNLDALRALMGGPSEADMMREAMAAIVNPQIDAENKMIAWENLEMMVQNLDNANNLQPLGMWEPLVKQLEETDADTRAMAAWTIGTAAQNNTKTQEKVLEFGAYQQLVKMATGDSDLTARKKAIYALSSGVRNFQPGLDKAIELLPAEYKPTGAIEAGDMEAIDKIIGLLREKAQQS
jgi:hsp70-interacting protein